MEHQTSIAKRSGLSSESLNELARALGYKVGPDQTYETPYINYILGQWPCKATLQDWVKLFGDVVQYFTGDEPSEKKKKKMVVSRTIKECIDKLVQDPTQTYFRDLPENDVTRQHVVTDTVLLIIGSWTLMQSYFRPQRGEDHRILLAYRLKTASKHFHHKSSLEETVPGLLHGSGLLPEAGEGVHMTQSMNFTPNTRDHLGASSAFPLHPSLGSVESLESAAVTLNAFKLVQLGAVRIVWTSNLSRHMLLSSHAKRYYLELFAMPGALQGGPDTVLKKAGIGSDVMDEICQSYANLFNPKTPNVWHKYIGRSFGIRMWCWCLCCSSERLRSQQLKKLKSNPWLVDSKFRYRSEIQFDPALERLMAIKATTWDQTEFRNFWPRIIALDAHLSEARPWSFWVIFRDRRDSVQFWTFLFGTVILFFTFLQVCLGVSQVIVAFN